MITTISHISILVSDQEKAKQFYTEKLGFAVYDDVSSPDGWRWVTVGPKNNSSTVFTLMLAQSDEDKAVIGKQTGRTPLCVLTTDDCHKTTQELKDRDITFIKEPTDEFWGIDALFKDLYGNIFDLCQLKKH